MKKTFIRRISRYGYIDGDLTDWHKLIESFAGQEVVITIETAEKEKSKVQMCGSYTECDRPAQWKITCRESGIQYRCNAHLWRCLRGLPTVYTIEAIPPEPPKPIVVEWEEDHRYFAYSVVTVPRELRNKRFKVRFEGK